MSDTFLRSSFWLGFYSADPVLYYDGKSSENGLESMLEMPLSILSFLNLSLSFKWISTFSHWSRVSQSLSITSSSSTSLIKLISTSEVLARAAAFGFLPKNDLRLRPVPAYGAGSWNCFVKVSLISLIRASLSCSAGHYWVSATFLKPLILRQKRVVLSFPAAIVNY